ncbi:hypothetical protein AB4383_01365 [Vibrio breoganii]
MYSKKNNICDVARIFTKDGSSLMKDSDNFMKNSSLSFANYQYYNYAMTLVIFLLCLLTVFNICSLSSVDFYRQDSMYYLGNYEFRFITEGRWLNLLTFAIFKKLPPWFLIFGFFISALCFFYLVASNISHSRLNSFLFSLLCINSPTLYSLMLWPVVPFSSYFMLLAIYFYSKKAKHFDALILCGVFSFGIMSNLHFLAPLIFMGDLIKQSFKENFIFFLKWVITFIIGFIVANSFVYLVTLLKTGTPTFINIDLQTWRLLKSPGGIDGLLYNIKYAINVVFSDIVDGKFYILLLGFIFSFSEIFKRDYGLKLFVWSVLIYLSFYSSNVFHGIRIDFRSLISAFVGLAMLNLLTKKRVANIYVCLCISLFSYDNFNKLNWYDSQVKTIISRFFIFHDDISRGGELAIVYWNPKFKDSFNLDVSDKPYGLIDLNHFKYKQINPYLIEQGFEKVEFIEYDIDYTGEIRYERVGETVYFYME